jgi:hypothetical protein
MLLKMGMNRDNVEKSFLEARRADSSPAIAGSNAALGRHLLLVSGRRPFSSAQATIHIPLAHSTCELTAKGVSDVIVCTACLGRRSTQLQTGISQFTDPTQAGSEATSITAVSEQTHSNFRSV